MKTNLLLKRVKYLFEVLNGSTPASGEAEFWDGDIPWATPDDIGKLQGSTLRSTRRNITEAGFQSCGTNLAPAGSIVMTTRAPVGNLALAGVPLCTNQGCKTLVPRHDHSDTRYFYYQLFTQTEELNIRATGTTFLELGTQDLRDFSLFNPTQAEQRAIAGFLDRETARLDALVAAKERWLELLAEKRRALITRAVTRGLNPVAPLRDSGLPWLGQIPRRWKLERLKWLINVIVQGWSPVAEQREASSGEWAVVKISAIKQGHFVDTEQKALPPGSEPPPEMEIKPGQFLLTRGNTPELVGDVCVVERTQPKLIISDLVYRLELKGEVIEPHFLKFVLLTQTGRCQIEADARGSSQSMAKIHQEHIANWVIPFPSLPEQRAIVAHISAETAKLDGLRAATERTIGLLKERRAALIAAAVTGKHPIEVCESTM